MDTQVVYQLIPIKEEILEPPSDINFEMIKTEPIDDKDDLMDSSRGESVDELELTVEKQTRTYGEMPIKNEFMEPAPLELDPLDISPESIKREIIDDDDFSIGSHALPINTIITVQPKTYVTKSADKKISKSGKDYSSQTISNKTSRKDKGKTRFTSYMLWAREKRQQLLSTHPEHHFVTISRELGKMWANVPSNEKYNWKRRAQRFNAKTKKDEQLTNNWTHSPVLTDEGLQENGTPFSKIKQGAGKYFPCESSSYSLEEWTITEQPESPPSPPVKKRKRKTIEDDDFFPTKKERLERDKLIYGTRPRGRPKKLSDCERNDIPNQKENVKSPTKTSSEIKNLENCSLNQTSEVVRIKVEFD